MSVTNKYKNETTFDRAKNIFVYLKTQTTHELELTRVQWSKLVIFDNHDNLKSFMCQRIRFLCFSGNNIILFTIGILCTNFHVWFGADYNRNEKMKRR